MVMIKSKISRITQPKTRKQITSQKNQVTGSSDLYDITSPVNGTLPGFSGQELAEASDVHQDIRMWLAQNGAVKNPVVFSSKELQEREPKHFFFFGGGGVGVGATKKKEGGNAKLTRIEVPLNDETFQSVCLPQEKTWGTNFFKDFCLVQHWWFPFCYWFGGGQEVGSWGFGKCHWHYHRSAFASQGKS